MMFNKNNNNNSNNRIFTYIRKNTSPRTFFFKTSVDYPDVR